MNVLQILAVTSIGFVLFAILWVVKIEPYLEQREQDQTNKRNEQLESETQT